MRPTDVTALFIMGAWSLVGPLSTAAGQSTVSPTKAGASAARITDVTTGVLSPTEWRDVDAAVDRALDWLASQQQPDGSFPTIETGHPGVTSLCVMAFLSHGHVPGNREHGDRLEKATDFILACQKQNGLISRVGPDGAKISRQVEHEIGVCAAYNHAISSLLLCELYGMSTGERAEQIQRAVSKALTASLEMQRWEKARSGERGGWRYIHRAADGADSDLSITGWELMFLRSARNAGFNVPKQNIDDAIAYVRRCFSEEYGTFQYLERPEDRRSRAMAGAGILALAHAGFHNAPETKKAGDWILKHNLDEYNIAIPFQAKWSNDRYHYAVLNCCQGMYQLGGRYWEEFFPRTVRTLLNNQQADGSWPADSHWHDGMFGNAYTTSLVVISLGAPNQLLPIFQR